MHVGIPAREHTQRCCINSGSNKTEDCEICVSVETEVTSGPHMVTNMDRQQDRDKEFEDGRKRRKWHRSLNKVQCKSKWVKQKMPFGLDCCMWCYSLRCVPTVMGKYPAFQCSTVNNSQYRGLKVPKSTDKVSLYFTSLSCTSDMKKHLIWRNVKQISTAGQTPLTLMCWRVWCVGSTKPLLAER